MPPNKGATLTGWKELVELYSQSCELADSSDDERSRRGQIVSCKIAQLSSMLAFAAICSPRICPRLYISGVTKML